MCKHLQQKCNVTHWPRNYARVDSLFFTYYCSAVNAGQLHRLIAEVMTGMKGVPEVRTRFFDSVLLTISPSHISNQNCSTDKKNGFSSL